MRIRTSLFAASLAIAAAASMASADVTGKITLNGKAPEPKPINMKDVKECAAMHADPQYEEFIVAGEKGELANVVISIKTDDAGALGGEVSKTPAVLDQKGCMYVPHVLAMMVGQEFVVKNDDNFLHNVQSLAQTNPGFNKAQQSKNAGEKVDSPKAAEIFKMKCQVHPWMGAWIAVFDHPFFAVSKEDGTFALPKGLPDGDYTVQAWHEQLGTKEGKVTVKGGAGTIDFKFDMKTAQAEPTPGSPVMASSTGAAEACPVCDAAAETAKPAAK